MNNLKGTLLLVDDDDVFRRTASRALQRRGFTVYNAGSGESALALSELEQCETAIVDLKMPGMNGLELVSRLIQQKPILPVIVLTGHGTISTAIEAIKQGAFHYLTKPCDIQELQLYLERAIERFRMQSENRQLRSAMQRTLSDHGIVGKSTLIRTLLDLIDRVKDADAPVLIQGEPGTGKERVARALHDLGKRQSNPFMLLSGAARHASTLEAELFGSLDESSGQAALREGVISLARNGSVYLNGIHTFPQTVQEKILHWIETGEYSPVRSPHVQLSNTRLIASAPRDLAFDVAEGRFREDLYYRLHVLTITTPPLRDHREDIPLLVESWLQHAGGDTPDMRFTPAAMDALQQYHWPGNIRELFNVCERALLVTSTHKVTAETIQGLLDGPPDQPLRATADSPAVQTLEEVERGHIQSILQQVQGNVSQAADILNIDRRTLQRKMIRFGLRES